MACDIHDYLEIRREGRWEYAGDDAFPGNEYDFEKHSPFDGVRSYGLYGFLADVRNYSQVPSVACKRGLPADVTSEVQAQSEEWDVNGHSHTWVSLAELLAYDYDQVIWDRRVTKQISPGLWSGAAIAQQGEDEHLTLREFLGEWFFGRLELLKKFGAPEDVRIIMWFDN